jgi:transketolase
LPSHAVTTSKPKETNLASSELDQLCINTIRFLAVDAVEKANSGHPGLPMDAAAMTYVLWTKFMKYHPRRPKWPNRDRFILSAGHGSMLLYSLLFLTGYDLSLDDIKQFRQWGSRTPGHPERLLDPGIETTTGPLGQGFGNGVGMAIAGKHVAARFNQPGQTLVDYKIYGLVSDGDLMEGVASEAASLAGHLGLDNLIYLYDNNHVTLEGPTETTFTEDVGKRFEAYDWFVQNLPDGNDLGAVENALRAAQNEKERPSLIIARTHIGYGSPNKHDSYLAHGNPLGQEEVKLTKQNLGWPLEPAFYLPAEVVARFRTAIDRGAKLEEDWNQQVVAYRKAYPQLAAEWDRYTRGEITDDWKTKIPRFDPSEGPLATRQASGKVLNAIATSLPTLIGGSADLNPSTDTYLKGQGDFEKGSYKGRNLHFGVREHAMGSIVNGLALSGFLAYGATFFNFSDYMRPTIRLAALMEARSIFVYTHDSVFLGEDGPTHQPIEQLASLRAIPNLCLIRPADANETAVAWRVAIEHKDGPVALVLTRQKLPVIDRTQYASAEGLERGAYVLADADGTRPGILLIATGSEVSLALEAFEELKQEPVAARVVSMPSWDLFAKQPAAYQEQVLPSEFPARLAIEAASPFGWERYVGPSGAVIGMNRFGASAPYKVLQEKFGFTKAHVVAKAREVWQSLESSRL